MPNGKEKCDTKYTGGRMDIKRDWSGIQIIFAKLGKLHRDPENCAYGL